MANLSVEGSTFFIHPNRAVARALIGGGGGGAGVYLYSCYAGRISFEISCFLVNFKRN